jgi:hypothetical protein
MAAAGKPAILQQVNLQFPAAAAAKLLQFCPDLL